MQVCDLVRLSAAGKKIDQNKLNLSEFGVGMKNAAFKFSPKWHLITKALNEKIEKTKREQT